MNRSHALRGAVVAVALAVLGGCGHQPGAAFQVDDTVVTRSTVDTVVEAQCRLLADSGQTSGATARSQLVWAIVNRLFDATVVNAYAATVSASYDATALRQQTAQLDQITAKLPAGERTAFTQALTNVLRSDLIAQRVGAAALQDKGQANPTDDEARAAGLKLARAWAAKREVHVDPRYNVGSSDKAGAGDGSISVPVTTFAKRAAAGSGSQAFTAGLPAGQLCG